MQIKSYTRRQIILFTNYMQKAKTQSRMDALDNMCIAFNGKPHPMSDKVRKTP